MVARAARGRRRRRVAVASAYKGADALVAGVAGDVAITEGVKQGWPPWPDIGPIEQRQEPGPRANLFAGCSIRVYYTRAEHEHRCSRRLSDRTGMPRPPVVRHQGPSADAGDSPRRDPRGGHQGRESGPGCNHGRGLWHRALDVYQFNGPPMSIPSSKP